MCVLFSGVWGRYTVLGYLRVDFLSQKVGSHPGCPASLPSSLLSCGSVFIYVLDAAEFGVHYGVLGVSLRSPSSSRCGQDNQ